MKQLFLAALLGTICLQAKAETIKTIKPKPVKATVYLSGAEIAYLESLTLPAGTNEIIIEGVAPQCDETSISAFFKGGLVIDTRKNTHYPEPTKLYDLDGKYEFFLNRINDSIEEMDFQVQDCNNKLATYEKEEYLLLNNRLMRGEFTKDSLPLLKASLDLLRTRLINIDEEQLALERRLSKISKVQTKLYERQQYYTSLLNSGNWLLNPEPVKVITQIAVTIEATEQVTGNLNLKYYVPNAGWVPMYEIQANSGKEKVRLVYRAQVYQNTGLDWKDVSLVLSTSNPSVGNTRPVLTAWNLYYGYPNSYAERLNYDFRNNNGMFNQYPGQLKADDLVAADTSRTGPGDEPPLPLFTVNDNLLMTEYEIKTRYSIKADNKAHHVIINTIDIPVSLAYLTVPKLDKDAFLMGKVANWEDLNLLPASAKIYFDESYIGLTVVEPSSTKDTMYLNLGRDKSIIVKRQALKDKSREQVLGEYKIINKTIEITVRNTKDINLSFEIEDQVPITSDNSIRITVGDYDKAMYNPVTGKLTWKLNIKPKDTKKVVFSYEVKYPKDKTIASL